jgi:hypothetical protein
MRDEEGEAEGDCMMTIIIIMIMNAERKLNRIDERKKIVCFKVEIDFVGWNVPLKVSIFQQQQLNLILRKLP